MSDNKKPVSICEALCCICQKLYEIKEQNTQIINLLTCDCKDCDCDKKDTANGKT